MKVLEGLQPAAVFRYFEEICAIPHASGNRRPLSDYCVNFAKARGYKFWQDAAYNVIIKKPASSGYEDAKPVIIQGHLDMVAEKTADCPIDFEKDGLKLQIDGDWVTAENTTLGADNGIAIAMGLAILDDTTLEHPPLEMLFTTDEEVGMLGAADLDASPLEGRWLLNLDSEAEGEFTVGCAGGVRANCEVPMKMETFRGTEVNIEISGLAGGHSGCMIHLGRGNACILLGRVLNALNVKDYRIVSLCGGGKDNVIANHAAAKIAVADENMDSVLNSISLMTQVLKKEYAATDENLTVTTAAAGVTDKALSKTATEACVSFLTLAPNGVYAMNSDMPDLVQTSLNLGILNCSESNFSASFSVRSMLKTQKEMLTQKLEALTGLLGGSVNYSGEYPAWEYRRESELRDMMVEAYRDMFGKEPKIIAIHGGLECGVLSEKLPGLDVVSYGPDIPAIHSVEEKMSISSVKRVWEFTLEVLRRCRPA